MELQIDWGSGGLFWIWMQHCLKTLHGPENFCEKSVGIGSIRITKYYYSISMNGVK